MATLTVDQIAFLHSHKINPDDLFDASGTTPAERKAAMAAQGKRFYFGGSQCEAAGHTLRVKAGHCIQCNTKMISFGTRFSKASKLYVAGSLQGRCVKIGLAADPAERQVHLRSECYGGLDDWKILAITERVNEAGRVESLAQASLMQHRKQVSYQKGGTEYVSREMFSCSFPEACMALAEVLPSAAQLQLTCTLPEAKLYEWRGAK